MPPPEARDVLTAPHVDTYRGGIYTTPSLIAPGDGPEREAMAAEKHIKDARAWSPIDTGYLDNPKLMDVLDASCNAALMHFASILYCAQHLTDGHLSPGAARRKVGGTRDDDALLIAAGLWHAPGHDCEQCPQPDPGKVYVHDFLEHNRTSDKTKRVSEKRSAAARARWERVRAEREAAEQDDAPRMQSALQDAVQKSNGCNAEREKEREKEILVTSEIAGTALAVATPPPPPREDVEALCLQLADRIEANGSKRPTIGKRWRDAARLMIDADGRSPEQIAYLIEWSQADEFWKGNILSMPKLREKFDTLRMQSQRPAPGGKPRVGLASQMDALRFYEGK